MSRLVNFVLRPGPGGRDLLMGLGGLLLVLAVIAMAGSNFTFDPETKARLRPIAGGLALAGLLCWVRGSIVPASERRQRSSDPSS